MEDEDRLSQYKKALLSTKSGTQLEAKPVLFLLTLFSVNAIYLLVIEL